MSYHDGDRFDRLPQTPDEQETAARPTRGAVRDYWQERFGIPPETFDGYTFWVKGKDAVWLVAGTEPTPIAVESLGLRLLRTGGRHWKPTTNAVQRFGDEATRNVIKVDRAAARRFVRGEGQQIGWDGDWGYLIVSTPVAGTPVPLGVGLYTYGELASMVPKARRVDLE